MIVSLLTENIKSSELNQATRYMALWRAVEMGCLNCFPNHWLLALWILREAKNRGRNKGINCRFILAKLLSMATTTYMALYSSQYLGIIEEHDRVFTHREYKELRIESSYQVYGFVEFCRDGLSKLFPESLTACFMNTFGMLTKLFRYRPSIMRQLMKIRAVVWLMYKTFYLVVVRLMNATWWTLWRLYGAHQRQPCGGNHVAFDGHHLTSGFQFPPLIETTCNILECNHSFHGSLLGSILRTMNFTYNALLFYMGTIRPNPPCDFGNVNIDQATLVADFK